jgi:hypothetical protein
VNFDIEGSRTRAIPAADRRYSLVGYRTDVVASL